MNKKQLFVSMTAQIVSFAVSMGVSFVLSPYLANAIDVSASGFVTQGNQFVSYAQILVSALNTMASRFITVSIHQGKEEEANQYFSSVFFGNVFMAAVFAVPATFLILFIDRILNVPEGMVTDLQIMLFFVMLNFVLSIILSVFSVSVYARDRLDLLAVKTIQAELVKMFILVGCYTFLRPFMWYVGIGSVVYTLVLGLGNYRYTKRLMPEVHISRRYFDLKKIWELVSLGAWNSVTRLGQTLLEGLDLLIANILIDPTSMGLLDFAKKVPLCIVNLMSSVVGIFNPQITILYAEGKYDEMVQMIKSANRIMIFMLSIPIAFVTAFGDIFFSLWLPAYDAHQLHVLCCLSMGTLYISMSIQVLYHIFIITKKVKWNSIVVLLSGVCSTGTVFLLLKTTNLGLYAIVLSSAFYGWIRNLLFTPLYASRCLKLKWTTFYGDIATGIESLVCVGLVGVAFRMVFDIHSWTTLIVYGCMAGVAALAVNYLIILKKEERMLVSGFVKRKLHIGGSGKEQ